MPCSCTCKVCDRKFDRYSGYLLNISDSLREELSDKEEVQNLSEQGKHFVLCSKCIENIIDRRIKLSDMKFASKRDGLHWYTSNLLYLYKKAVDKGTKIIGSKGSFSIGVDVFNEYVNILKSKEDKGILNLKKFDIVLQNNEKLIDLRVKQYLL